jgi:glycosyltransferase involved in cell wall biosynthesis
MIENNLIQQFKYICAPSLWMENHVKFYNSEALVFQNHLLLRREYYSANKWDYSGSPVIICSSGYPAAFKGIHDLVKATHILKAKGINIRLRIIGNFNSKGIKGDGYSKYLKKLILDLGLLDSVEFLGPLNSSESIEAILNSSVMVFPSYVESYGVAFAEAMYLGVPTICAYNGGSSFLGIDNQTTLFFEAGDFQWCSQLIENIIGDKLLGEKLSKNAIEIAESRHSIKKIIDKQISIYENIIFKQS